MSEFEDTEVATIARVLRVVGTRFPFKKKRMSRIAKEMPELIPKLEGVGLIHKWVFGSYVEDEAKGLYDVWDEYCEMARKKA